MYNLRLEERTIELWTPRRSEVSRINLMVSFLDHGRMCCRQSFGQFLIDARLDLTIQHD